MLSPPTHIGRDFRGDQFKFNAKMINIEADFLIVTPSLSSQYLAVTKKPSKAFQPPRVGGGA